MEELVSRGIGSRTVAPLVISRLALTLVVPAIETVQAAPIDCGLVTGEGSGEGPDPKDANMRMMGD
jgi:hypothetical protein